MKKLLFIALAAITLTGCGKNVSEQMVFIQKTYPDSQIFTIPNTSNAYIVSSQCGEVNYIYVGGFMDSRLVVTNITPCYNGKQQAPAKPVENDQPAVKIEANK